MTPRTRDRVVWALAGLLGLLILLEGSLFGHHAPRFPWHHVPGYAAAIGLGGCVVVVLLSKRLGTLWLQRPEREDDDV